MSEAAFPEPEGLVFPDDGDVPNHPHFPVLLYRGVAGEAFSAEWLEETFRGNGWSGCWRWGVYPFHHFHSNAHEVLGVFRGCATLRLGGPGGTSVRVEAGDVIVLPAGTGHCCEEDHEGFTVVGAYPGGADADLIRAGEGEAEAVRQRIAAVPVPEADPLAGPQAGLRRIWTKQGQY